MNAMDIRNKFIEYFIKKGHKEISGASVVPENDPSVLFTTAGMHPLVPFLLGEKHPQGKRLVDYQKCIRTDDIEEVGDDIHITFFEMLGNWSVGEYFKEDAIKMSFDFLVNWLQLDPGRLSVTVFEGDEDSPKDIEAMNVWMSLGISDSNIFTYGKKQNWWGPVGLTGPCGPDTEIFYDSLKPKCSDDCSPACSCGKYWEIWNNVFMQYNKNAYGYYSPLAQKNVDTGLGLERITAIVEGKQDIYQTELFSHIIDDIKSASVISEDISIRIIADHIRASCFIIADEVSPSNIDQGYILRRLIRRAVRHMRRIGIKPDYITHLGLTVIESLSSLYKELSEQKGKILEVLSAEMNKFMLTLDKGERKLFKVFEQYNANSIKIIDAKTVFTLFDTYGFPPEITEELALENGFVIDMKGFEKLYRQHQELSRQGVSQKFKGGLIDNTSETTALHTTTHILRKALQIVLGEHVKQKGSNITDERLRFDFSHNKKVTPDELQKVEEIVNEVIGQGLTVSFEEMSLERAMDIGAEGLFTNKYGENVKVYSIGDFSKEICGGPHVENTLKLGKFKIVKEEGVSSGVRRIKAVLN
jgi:alanyl-tRNA synthetase